jgi:multidrug efflux pump subunit AcrA (membrane-fusion protein)
VGPDLRSSAQVLSTAPFFYQTTPSRFIDKAMHTECEQEDLHCIYPPRIADKVDVTEQIEEGETRYVIRNTATSRYFLLKKIEYQIFRQFDGTMSVFDIATGGRGASGPRVAPAVLTRFLTRLDSLGLLARGGPQLPIESHNQERGPYIRVHLFNPDRLLGSIDRAIGQMFGSGAIIASLALMIAVLFGLLSRASEVAAYTSHTHSEHGLAAIVLAILMITTLHEMAHGLACKHFGGDVRETGVLLIFYVLPALYCNVSDIYRFGRRRERLWVIFAGIYFQLVASAASAAVWMVSTPYSLLADIAFIVFLGASFNIIFNCNPLIKLDGYYALSQLVGEQNLQSRSSEYVRSLFDRILDGRTVPSKRVARPVLYISYWAGSIIYTLALVWLVLGWAGNYLMSNLGFAGVLITIFLALLLTEKWWRPFFKGVRRAPGESSRGVKDMSAQTAAKRTEPDKSSAEHGAQRRWTIGRRQVIKWSLVLLIITALVAPWEASTGSDCTLLLPPGREGVARANTDAVLREIFVQPGDVVAEGTKIARLVNPEIEDRLTQLSAEIERLTSNASRLEEELRVRSEMLLSANFKELDRKRVSKELKDESSRIAGAIASADLRILPPSLAVLQSEVELKQTELEHNRREVERYRKLAEQGLVGEQLYDRAVAAMRISEKELQGARARLEAALVEHRRLTSGAETTSLVAETDARAARSSFEALISELHANRQQLESLRQRREILDGEYQAMNILAPRAGVILGEDLQKMVGRRYGKGEEICRIGELEEFTLRIDVSEREIASVRLDSPVRFKLKTVPGRTFTGQVSKINAEPTPDEQGQRFYPVEVLVENSDGLLRPGMTGFARISFGRQSIGIILAEKLWHSLRPEMWLF